MEYSIARGAVAVNVFCNFLYATCVNCRGNSAVVSLNRSFLFLSMFCSVLGNGKASGFENL